MYSKIYTRETEKPWIKLFHPFQANPTDNA
jgi:hypothetical protein